MISLLLKGFITGLIVAAPMGPAGILCVRRIFTKGGRAGLLTGYGSATADVIFAILAGFGITIASNFIVQNRGMFELLSALILLSIGFREWFLKTGNKDKCKIKKQPLIKDYLSGLFITLLNPLTIIAFIAAYTLMGITSTNGFMEPFLVVVGSLFGAVFGWTALSFIIVKTRNKMKLKILNKINKVSGTILILFGLFLIFNAIHIFNLFHSIIF